MSPRNRAAHAKLLSKTQRLTQQYEASFCFGVFDNLQPDAMTGRRFFCRMANVAPNLAVRGFDKGSEGSKCFLFRPTVPFSFN